MRTWRPATSDTTPRRSHPDVVEPALVAQGDRALSVDPVEADPGTGRILSSGESLGRGWPPQSNRKAPKMLTKP